MFTSIHAKFTPNEYFLTAEQLREWQQSKPLEGIKILHNMPLYYNTLLKIEALLAAGAAVWVSAPRNIPPDPKAVAIVKELGLPFIPSPRPITEEFDLVLDCSADYACYVKPRIGVVEVTGTGSHFFQNNVYDYPVISVDDSRLKHFETMLGTGDGCIRGLQKWLPGDFSDRQFTVFGFGKVGYGIASRLQKLTNRIVIVDIDQQKVVNAQAKGFVAYQSNDSKLKTVIQQSFAVITATGHENSISNCFKDKSWFNNINLVNMGVHDEYGPAFTTDEVIFAKQAINFSLEEPTRMRYIDPIFYAHNLAATLLLSGKFKSGYHAFPPALDAHIIAKWQTFHGELLDAE